MSFCFGNVILRFYPLSLREDFAQQNQLVTTVQPLPCKEVLAVAPAPLGAAEVPPARLTVPFNWPAVSREIRMLLTLVWDRAQLYHEFPKLVAAQLSNILAGKDVKLVQSLQALLKAVP